MQGIKLKIRKIIIVFKLNMIFSRISSHEVINIGKRIYKFNTFCDDFENLSKIINR